MNIQRILPFFSDDVCHTSSVHFVISTIGYSFDLSPLTKTGDKAYYLISSSNTEHNYFINVCANVTSVGGTCATNSGCCQEQKTDSR